MGKKVNPLIIRISNIKNPAISWSSKWFSRKKNYAHFLKQDETIRKIIKKNAIKVGLGKIEIHRSGKGDIEVVVFVARPGMIIGRGGAKSEQLRKKIQKHVEQNCKLKLTIKEITKANLNASVLLEEAQRLIEKRMPFRRVMKKILDMTQKAGAKGAKISMAGRLNGVEIARHEKLSSGSMPLTNLRANIDYSRGVAHTKWGQIGIKIWIYKGEVFEKDKIEEA